MNLTGKFAADNTVYSAYLNGVLLFSGGYGTYNVWAPFFINSGFVSGTNTFKIIINNTGGSPSSSGFRLEVTPGRT